MRLDSNLQILDARAIAEALETGIHRIILSQETLNKINVFPVADGDTGTNLAFTLLAVRRALSDTGKMELNSLLAHIADAVLDGARGNSGAIMAQFFQGLSDSADELTCFSPTTFAAAARLGSEYAREALSEPREGTILSVITAFAEELGDQADEKNVSDFRVLLSRALDAAQLALEKTQHQLEELRKAGVVDAGAKGFVTLIEGMLAFIRDGEVAGPIDGENLGELDEFVETAGEDADLTYRFCTECIVTGTEIDRRRLREQLAGLGGSLVLAGTHSKARIHIHVNEPDAVFQIAGMYGDVSSEKADDMQRQQHSTHGVGARTAIITDSAADIPDPLLEALNIHVVPLRVHFGERSYMDKLTISTADFFAELARNPQQPRTSQPAPGDFRRQYQFLAAHFPDVLSISLTGTVSGTLSAAESAAARVSGPGNVHVFNSLNASVGQGLLVIEAAEYAAAGVAPDEIMRRLGESVARTRTFALLTDLTYAVRGGRVPHSRKLLADYLRISPVLSTTPDGRITSNGILLGRGRRLKKFARYICRRTKKDITYRLAVGHAACAADARQLAELLSDRLRISDSAFLSEIGAAIGVHGGPGTLVVAIQERLYGQ